MDIKKTIADAVANSNQLSPSEKSKIMNKLATSNPKIIPLVNKTISINGVESNLGNLPLALKGLLVDNNKNGIPDIVENAFQQTNNANLQQNSSNYIVQNKSFNLDSGNSKVASNLKSGAKNYAGISNSQSNYSNVNPADFAQKAQPFKIGNGIDANLAKKALGFFVTIAIIIGFLAVAYYILAKYLGITISMG